MYHTDTIASLNILLLGVIKLRKNYTSAFRDKLSGHIYFNNIPENGKNSITLLTIVIMKL